MAFVDWRSAAAAILVVTAASGGAHAAPGQGKLETYRDWTIGCDNGGRCQAVSLMPEGADDWDASATVVITRDGGGTAEPSLAIHLQSTPPGPLSLVIDGRTLASGSAVDDTLSINGAAARGVIVALAGGTRLELVHAGAVLARASLSGSSAALRYMDAQQGRAGTTTALVATGKLGARAVKAPPALPQIYRAIVPAGPAPAPLWAEERTRANALTGCTDEYNPGIEPELHPLSRSLTLVLLPCGAGAYNYSSVPLLATGKAGRRTFVLARFDEQPGWMGDDKTPMLVNAGWNPGTSALSSYAKGRGLGDCGHAATYVWDGAMFRIVETSAMGECRGSWQWITLLRTKVGTSPRSK